MKQLTENQYNSLVGAIYNVLMSCDSLDMESMGEAREKAQETVTEWANTNGILLP